MSKEKTINSFFELARKIHITCSSIDADKCEKGECPFSIKDKDGNASCVFEDHGFGMPSFDWEV